MRNYPLKDPERATQTQIWTTVSKKEFPRRQGAISTRVGARSVGGRNLEWACLTEGFAR